MRSVVEWLETTEEEVLRLEPKTFYDPCLVGVGYRCGSGPVLAYSMRKIISKHVASGMTYSEARDFFESNTLGLGWVRGLPYS